MYKIMTQNANATSFLNIAAPDETLKISHERNNPKVLGRGIPHTRINALMVVPRPYMPKDCVDACAIPGEVTNTVRVIASGPTVDKTIMIEQLEYLVATLKDEKLENVWEGLPPSSSVELPLTYVGV